jgi:hypothetical protein
MCKGGGGKFARARLGPVIQSGLAPWLLWYVMAYILENPMQ